MKKLLPLMLVILMLVGLVGTSLAEAYYLEAAGVTIDVPEGMLAEDASDEDVYGLLMAVEGREDLLYGYSLAYIEELEDIWLEDLSEEELVLLIVALGMEFEEPEFDVAENDGIYYLIIYEADLTELHYISLLNGWLTDVWVMTDGTAELAEAEVELCEYLILSITYDEE